MLVPAFLKVLGSHRHDLLMADSFKNPHIRGTRAESTETHTDGASSKGYFLKLRRTGQSTARMVSAG